MIVGIAGTAKNTGKTTALAALIKECSGRHLPIAVTGIGYDGEERDTITLLPKPRIILPEGTIATTSERCFPVSTAGWEILHRTGINTPLGEVIVLLITRPGLLVVAGPNKTTDLAMVCALMSAHVEGPIFVDGSLNRIAPLVVANRLVIATGASRTTNLGILARETASIEAAFALPRSRFDGEESAGGRHDPVALYSAGDAESLMQGPHAARVALAGVFGLDALQALAAHPLLISITEVILEDPVKLLLTGDIVRAMDSVRTICERGVLVSLLRAPRLVAITANPYFPAYQGMSYTPSFVNRDSLLSALRGRVQSPVIDIVHDGAGELLDALLAENPALDR